MSRLITVSKAITYESPNFKTPNFKEVAPAACTYDPVKDVPAHQPILMDEYGQTPDHYYLAKKPPPSFYQVKRKLDLQSYVSPVNNNSKTAQNKPKKKNDGNCEKIKGKLDKPRYDTSLGQLTKKFLKLLSDASDGIVNLNTACTVLSVPKRRLYDITNVLEGAGLIRKSKRNNIQWMGRLSSPCGNIAKYQLEKEIDILEAKENKLDELIYYMKSQMKSVLEKDSKYHYVTSEDLKSIADFSEKTLIGINTSPLVQITESNEKTFVLTSKNTEIEAYLLLEDFSFTNILHPNAVLQKNSYQVKLENKVLEETKVKLELPDENSCLNENDIPEMSSEDLYNQMCSGAVWNEGDTVIKNAFIAEEDDIAPIGKHFLLQTEDQDLDLPLFSFLESTMENYSFSLDDGEGLTDLFDCNFSCP